MFIADFIFEISTLRKIARSHRQVMLTDDISDNIASHSFVVTNIGIFLAQLVEGVNVPKVALMCISHDWTETRSNDPNWIHKKYIKVDVQSIMADQFKLYQSPYMKKIIEEYEERKTLEAIVAKDADILGQLILLKEYAHQGNEEAKIWLQGKSHTRPYAQVEKLKLEPSKNLGRAIYDTTPSDWWQGNYTNKNKN